MSASTLQKALENCKYDFDYQIRSYSGRGMYGKTCVAITGDNLNPFLIGAALMRDAEMNGESDVLLDDLMGMRSDSMGLGIVYYWPSVPFDGEEEDNEEEDE